MSSDNIQQQINSLIQGSQKKDESFEDEFLKEAGDGGRQEETNLPQSENSDNQSQDVPPQKIKPLYERMEDGEISFKNEPKHKILSGDDILTDRIKPASEEKQEMLGEKIKEMELKKKEEDLKNKAASLGQGYINLKGLPIMPEALRLIDEEESKREGIICFIYREDKEIRLAVLENTQETEQIVRRLSQEHSNVPVKVYLTSQASMQAALKIYNSLPKIIEETDEVKVLESDLEKSAAELKDLKELEERIKKISITEVFSLILAAAIKTESSDVHIEAEKTNIQVRFRVDGVLHDVAKLDKEQWEKLVARIKLNSKLKINVKDRPQDGHFSIEIKGSPVDFRVSTLPTAYGESVVMRILYHKKIQEMTLDSLGIEDYNREILDREIQKPNGMIVVTGPTGAGKTTTLYAVLNRLNTPANKIITVEDPVEYKIEGVNQSQVNAGKGYTFAKALRSIVRQDPDIILVGEIRDKETAEISLNAALTGHLVFTTLHANDAAGSIPRFLSLDVKPYLLAPAINISLAQRLVRRICPKCKQEAEISQSHKERAIQELDSLPDKYKSKFDFNIKDLKFYKARGCTECAGLGYKGQIGIFEIFEVTNEIRDMILAGQVSEHKLREIAQKNGMITMTQEGILKAIRGTTSLDEVFRVS